MQNRSAILILPLRFYKVELGKLRLFITVSLAARAHTCSNDFSPWDAPQESVPKKKTAQPQAFASTPVDCAAEPPLRRIALSRTHACLLWRHPTCR